MLAVDAKAIHTELLQQLEIKLEIHYSTLKIFCYLLNNTRVRKCYNFYFFLSISISHTCQLVIQQLQIYSLHGVAWSLNRNVPIADHFM